MAKENLGNDPNRLFKALAKLKGIKANINSGSRETQEKYVNEYNNAANEISAVLEDDLETFIVPKEEIRPRSTGYAPSTGRRYSSDNWTETRLLLVKVDSLINYLEMLLQNEEPKKPMGFK